VAAAAEPRPALKYRLLPAPHERTPGNGATYYYRAILQQKMLPQTYWQEYNDRSEAWLTKDAAKYPKDDVQKWLQSQEQVLAQVKTATYREYCEWDLRVQDLRGMETISFLLAEFQESRTLARLLQLKAHDQIIAGRHDEALETIRQGYQLARDIARPPFLVASLIGIAIGQVMNQELTFLIERSDQNYYWALGAMSLPLVDLRPALEMEMNLTNQIFPFLKDADTAERSPEEWRKLVIQCFRDIELIGGGGESFAGWQNELAAAGLIAKLYPVAKQELIASGMSPERALAMPVGQVVAIQTARATEYAYHEIFKVFLLPSDEATRRLPEVMKQLESKDLVRGQAGLSGKAGIPVANLLLPAVHAVLHADARAARQLAALKAIEALRMHAAASGGKLPASLSEVIIVPVPKNPATGQPFPYSLDAANAAATLDVPAVGNLSPRQDGKRYVIKLRK
jgi:hypothetical protein